MENFVLMELKKQITWSQQPVRLQHWRTQTGQEVDFVMEGPAGAVVGLEVRASRTVDAADFRGLRALAEIAGKRFRRGFVLYAGSQAVAFGPEMYALPVSHLWEGLES